jgi:hypothetical protein
MTKHEIPRLVTASWTWWRENLFAILMTALPTALLLGFLLPFFFSPMRGRWLVVEVITAQTVGLLLGVILTAVFKGPKAFLVSTRSSTPLAKIQCALGEIGYCRIAAIGSTMIFRPTVRAGFYSGWITVREQDDRIDLSGPRRHLVRLLARLQPRDQSQ